MLMEFEIQRDVDTVPRGVETSSRQPLYFQIADHIRGQITAGQLRSGQRLPPIRDLAKRLRVNRDTVSLAYDLLARDGLVEATVGRGTFIRDNVAPPEPPRAAPPPLSPVVERLLDFEQARPRYAASDGAVPLHSLNPDPSLYPVAAFRRSVNRVLAEGGSNLLAYGSHQGNHPLREVIADRLSHDGIDTGADGVVLCQGASQGIALALRLYAEPGDWVAVEEPTYHNLLGALVGLGLRPAPIPMTDEGPDLQVLERTLARPEVKLFYTMPSFHNPMGTTTSIAQRRRLLTIAAQRGKPIIEDAFEMDLRYDGTPVSPLAALDSQGLVVHLFSFSKSLFPGVRVGAITARGRAVGGLLALKQTTDLSGAVLLQAAVADFVNSGAYDRHLSRLRKKLRERRDVMLESLVDEMPPGTHWTQPQGGYQVWLTLAEGADTRALLADAQREGLLFAPGYQFHHDGRPSRCLRLTTALAEGSEIERGIRILGKVVREHLAERSGVSRDTGVHV